MTVIWNNFMHFDVSSRHNMMRCLCCVVPSLSWQIIVLHQTLESVPS
jgi:hypothetical protein